MIVIGGGAAGLSAALMLGRARRRVLVASGITDELPAIPGLVDGWGRTVLHCPYCHGWEVRDRRLGVLAVSPLSLHLIELLRQWSDRVVAFTADLVAADAAAAVHQHGDRHDNRHDGHPQAAPAEYWEDRYTSAGRRWSGNVNHVLADSAAELRPGRLLDLGCGEGGDVIWLATQGWTATGIDISPTAVHRACDAARDAGIPADRTHFVTADLATLRESHENETYDLVTANFLQAPVPLPRAEILRAAALVAPGGHLLMTAHAAAPPWAIGLHGHEREFPTPETDLALLDLDGQDWNVLIAETRTRPATGPDGQASTLDDSVILVQRR